MQTWKPTVAGILDIIAGVHGFVGAMVLFGLAGVLSFGFDMQQFGPRFPAFFRGGLFVVIAISHIVFGSLAIIGGIIALSRRNWGWALTGGIASIFASFIWGIPAIIITALAESEFKMADANLHHAKVPTAHL